MPMFTWRSTMVPKDSSSGSSAAHSRTPAWRSSSSTRNATEELRDRRRDGFDDHPVEAGWSLGGVGEEVLEPAVAGDRDVEAGQAARAPGRVGAGARLDVVVVGDDPPAGLFDLALGVVQLAREAEAWGPARLRSRPSRTRRSGELGRRTWSWQDLLALSYLRLGDGSEQGRKRPALGRRQCPAGLATHQADLPPNGQGWPVGSRARRTREHDGCRPRLVARRRAVIGWPSRPAVAELGEGPAGSLLAHGQPDGIGGVARRRDGRRHGQGGAPAPGAAPARAPAGRARTAPAGRCRRPRRGRGSRRACRRPGRAARSRCRAPRRTRRGRRPPPRRRRRRDGPARPTRRRSVARTTRRRPRHVGPLACRLVQRAEEAVHPEGVGRSLPGRQRHHPVAEHRGPRASTPRSAATMAAPTGPSCSARTPNPSGAAGGSDRGRRGATARPVGAGSRRGS